MLTTMLLSVSLVIGQPTSPPKSATLQNSVSPKPKKTTAYVWVPPYNPCMRSVPMIRSDGPLRNPAGVVYVRVSNWCQLSAEQLHAIESYERSWSGYRR